MQVDEPRPYRWTREEYYRLSEAGFFLERRVELIDGEIVETPARTNADCAGVSLTGDALRAAFGPDFWVRIWGPLDLSPYSVPDPDLAVVPGKPRDYITRDTPTTALLIVEISDTTLSFDRRKANLYAQAGVADYWIVNIVNRRLEVYRNPVADAAEPFGFDYSARTTHEPGDAVAPLAAPKARVAVVELLP